MKDGSPKSWDKTPRSYEIKWPDGKKETWKDINAGDCVTEYESMDAEENELELREIVGKELKLKKIMDKK